MGCATSTTATESRSQSPVEQSPEGKQSHRADGTSSRTSGRIIAMRRERREDRPIPTEEETLAVAVEIRREFQETKDREDAVRLRRLEEAHQQHLQHQPSIGDATPLKVFKPLSHSDSDRATPSGDGRLSLSVFDLVASDEDPQSGDDEIDPVTPQPFAQGPYSPAQTIPGQNLDDYDEDLVNNALGFSPRRKYDLEATPRGPAATFESGALHRSRSSSVGSLGSSGNYSFASRSNNSRRASQRHGTPLESIREKLVKHRMNSTSAHYKPSVVQSALSDDETDLCPKHTPRIPFPGQAVMFSPGGASGSNLVPLLRPQDHPSLPALMARTAASPLSRNLPIAVHYY